MVAANHLSEAVTMSDYDPNDPAAEVAQVPDQVPAQTTAQLVGNVPAEPASQYTEVWRLAQRLQGTEFVPAAMRGKPEVVLAAILYGSELGLGPMQALQAVNVIQGKPSLGAAAQIALVRKAGHKVLVQDNDATSCTLEGVRTDGTSAVVTYTIHDAEVAGLADSNNWKQHPRQMLLARASTELVTVLFSDVIMGAAYDSDELGAL